MAHLLLIICATNITILTIITRAPTIIHPTSIIFIKHFTTPLRRPNICVSYTTQKPLLVFALFLHLFLHLLLFLLVLVLLLLFLVLVLLLLFRSPPDWKIDWCSVSE